MPRSEIIIALVTAPNSRVARKLAERCLEERVAACVNLIPAAQSIYRWEGAVERSAEVLMIIKSTRTKRRELEAVIVGNHPYELPEFVVITATAASRGYERWVRKETTKIPRKPRSAT